MDETPGPIRIVVLSVSVEFVFLLCLCFAVCYRIGMAGRSTERPAVFLQGEREILDKGSRHPAAGGGTRPVGARIENELSFRC